MKQNLWKISAALSGGTALLMTGGCVLAQSGATATAGAPKPLVWQPLYEPGSGGAITAVAVSPHDSKHLITLGDMLGVATSFDGGDSWQSTFGFSSYEFSGGVTWHPTNPKVVWIGSAMGPYKSTDGGINWVSKRKGMPALSDGRYTAIIEKILFDPTNPNRLLAFSGTSRWWNEADTFGWIWESTDGGENWNHIGTISDKGFSKEKKKGSNIHWIEYKPGSKNEIHLLAGGIGWMVSTDNGRTWKKHEYSGIPTGVRSLTFNPKNPQVIWATTASYTTEKGDATREPGGLYKSTDSGKTFVQSDKGIKKINAKQHGDLTSNFNNVVVSAANPNVLFTNDGAWNSAVIYKSTDGGANWVPVATRSGVGVDHAAANQKVFNPKTATHAGISVKGVADPKSADVNYWYNTEFILRTRDGGKTWDDATAYQPDPKNKPNNWRGRGWVGWCATNFSWNPYRKTQAIAQAMDAGKAWISDDNLQSWQYAESEAHPWLGGVDLSFTKDGHIFITTGQFGDNNGIMRSRDWGKTWEVLSGAKRGLPDAGWGKKPEYGAVYAHPENSKNVWVTQSGKVLGSFDGGEIWKPVTADFGASFMAGDPTKAGRFYVTARDGVYVTEDGKSFNNIGGPRPGGRGRINVDSRGRVLVCLWRGGRAGVWRYDPKDKSWTRLLDEYQAFEAVADPSDPTRLLMVTNMDPYNDLAGGNGVWISHDDGKSWSQQDNGLAMRRGQAVAFNPHNPEEIVVGTFGRGFFRTVWPKTSKPAGTRRYAALPEDAAYAAIGGSILTNGSMTDGSARPAGWDQTWDKVVSSRDTSTYKSAPASLQAKVENAGGMAFQQIEGHAGEKFRVTGWIKTAGDARVNVAVQTFDKDWTKNDFNQIKYLQGAFDWQPFEKDVTIPDWGARFNVAVQMEGNGTAWLDDIQLVPLDAKNPSVLEQASTQKPTASGEITRVITDFGGFNYGYGPWEGKLSTGNADGVGYAQIDATEHGGAGVVLNGMDITPQKQTHLAMRARLMPGNAATRLSVNLIGSDKNVTFDLSKLSQSEWRVITTPLPDGGKYNNIQQLQVQGTNWSPGAPALKIQIDKIGATSLDEKANAAAKEAAAKTPGNSAPEKDKASVPAWGFFPDHPQAWMAMHNGYVNRTKEGAKKKDIKVVFFGDSITQGWGGAGKEVWEKKYAPLGAVNYGIGGDSTRQVLWRIQNGSVEGINPKLVVLRIGTNNLYGDFNAGSDEEIADGVKAIVQELRKRLPSTRILLLGLLPRQNEWFSNRVKNINNIISKLDDGKNIRYLDMSDKFQTQVGKVVPELYDKDQLHLAKPGYEMWAEQMQPLFDEMMK